MKRGSMIAWLAVALAAPVAPAAGAPASLTQYRCYICHADQEALAGPAFADIAAVYRGERDAVRRMAGVIRAGASSGGPWHMPPHPEVSPRVAREMARYILSLERPPESPEARPAR